MADKRYVSTMFDNIAEKYDFLNHFLSFGVDKYWRRRLVKEIKRCNPQNILDIATGTGDMAIALTKTKAKQIIGIDISKKMLEKGQQKIKKKHLENRIKLQYSDGESLEFDDNFFDAVTVAFGVRNFENIDNGLKEIYRTLKQNGMAAILEFSMPKNFIVRKFYCLYFFYILPFFGKLFSKNKYAYSYLPQSVKTFPKREEFLQRLQAAGFNQVRRISLTFGIAEIYIGYKN
jgi:demethylmenaquinone methyltransferase/2-methoxy-6-polyprenyl-1,4-benzoquinol methylase